MKKSELKKYIRENVISELSESTEDEITATKELTKAVQDLDSAKKEAGIEEGEDNWADYTDIGQSYLEGFGKEHTLDDNQLEELGKKIVKQLYKGDIGKAYDEIVKRDLKEANIGLADLEEVGYTDGDKAVAMHFNQDVVGINNDVDFQSYRKGFIQGVNDATIGFSLNENEDAEPTKSDIKKTKGLAKAKEELALLTREMKSLAKKYSKAEGADKEKLVKILKDKTKLKKELESILDNKKI